MMKTETKTSPATALPWETRPVRKGVMGDESSMKDAGNDLNAVEPQMFGGTRIVESGIPKQDAAYIVAACNAYPELVAALKDICKGWDSDTSACVNAKAILRKLGEE